MVERRRGLGRGLGALIPSGEPETPRTAAGSQNEAADVRQKPESSPRRQRTGSGGGAKPPRTSGDAKNTASTGKGPKTVTAGEDSPSSTRTTTRRKATSSSAGPDAAKKAGSGAKQSSKVTEVDAPSRAGVEKTAKSKRSTVGKAPTGEAKTADAKKSSGADTDTGTGSADAESARGNATSPENSGAHADFDQPANSSGHLVEAAQDSTKRENTGQKDRNRANDVSRETSGLGASRSGARTADATGRTAQRRRDMGQALRSTTNVSRPVDMFFLPSDPDSFSGAPSSPVGSSHASSDDDAVSQQTSRRDETSSESTTCTPAFERDSFLPQTPVTFSEIDQKPFGGAASELDVSSREVDVSRETSAARGSEASGPQRAGEEPTGRGTKTRDGDASLLAENSPETAPDSVVSAPEKLPAPAEASGDDADLRAVPGATFAELAVTDIHPNRKQPRQVFDEDELEELAFSVKELGVLQPIVVRPSRDGGPETYELVMGERRWRAVQAAGIDSIPAIVRETADDDLLRDALLENLHRAQLNPLEEAAAYQQLMEEFGATQEQLSERIGRSRPQISNTLRLLRLPALVQRRVAAGVLSSGHARALLALTDPAEMERLAQRIVAEGLSVRATEEAVALSDGLKRQSSRRKAPSTRHDDRLGYIADAFSDKLDTSVKIQLGARKGKMTIEFASVEDLNRIIDVLDPKLDPES